MHEIRKKWKMWCVWFSFQSSAGSWFTLNPFFFPFILHSDTKSSVFGVTQWNGNEQPAKKSIDRLRTACACLHNFTFIDSHVKHSAMRCHANEINLFFKQNRIDFHLHFVEVDREFAVVQHVISIVARKTFVAKFTCPTHGFGIVHYITAKFNGYFTLGHSIIASNEGTAATATTSSSSSRHQTTRE